MRVTLGRCSRRCGALAIAGALTTGALYAAAPAAVAGCADPDSGVVVVSKTTGKGEGEASLSVNPLDSHDLIVGSNQFEPIVPGLPVSAGGALSSSMWSSQDGGCTWTEHPLGRGGFGNLTNPLAALAPGTPTEFRDVGNIVTADQHSAWDRHGNAYYGVGLLGDPSAGGDQQERVWRSTDQARTFGPPVIAYSSQRTPSPPGSAYPGRIPTLDRPWFAVDNTGGPRDGTIYLTLETGPFSHGTPPEVYAQSSTDQGQTWSPVVRVDDGLFSTQNNPRALPSVGADGALYVVYDNAPPTVTVGPTPQLGKIALRVGRSTDGAKTFSRLAVDDDVHRIQSPDEALPYYTEMIPAIAADPAHPGHVAVAWAESTSTTSSRVVARTSSDGGKTWSARTDVADDPARNDDQHDHVTLTYTPDGRLIAAWRDRRCCGGGWGDPFQLWARLLTPEPGGPIDPEPAIQMTDSPQAPTTAKRGGALVPDEFIGLVADRDSVMASWAQVVGDLADDVFRRRPLRALSTPTVLPASRSCASRRAFTIRLRHGRARITRATVTVNGRRVSVRRRRGRVTSRIDLRGLPRTTITVRVRVRTSDGRTYDDSRTYRTCRPRPGHRARELRMLRAASGEGADPDDINRPAGGPLSARASRATPSTSLRP